MKRIFFCVIWFAVFGIVGVMGGGAVAGGIAGSKLSVSNPSEAYAQGKQAGYIAGAEFGRKYGKHVLLAALIAAIVGTASGILPGTKKKSSA